MKFMLKKFNCHEIIKSTFSEIDLPQMSSELDRCIKGHRTENRATDNLNG